MMTNISTQIVIDDDTVMEYEVNPQLRSQKRPHYRIHDTMLPPPTTFLIGTKQPSTLAKAVGIEDGVEAPGSSHGFPIIMFSLFLELNFCFSCLVFELMFWEERPPPSHLGFAK